ncbi:MAG TPA: bis(5'-nucleosyl)-tetraphosphatase (symmetrical) YqeK [Clostridia bacterium]|nr:bis(5'-nucleosyl)-tetraphosphatase (symmetrical) YqeK [Clostridia bacterium]
MDFKVAENKIIDSLREKLNPERFNHSLGVAETAVKIAVHYGVDIQKARLAGLLHDCARYLSLDELLDIAKKNNIDVRIEEEENPSLLHAPVGLIIAKECYNIESREVLNAIASHTLGSTDMSELDKIIYLADKIEPGRRFQGVGYLRELVYKDIDEALLWHLDYTIAYLINNAKTIHPQSVSTRNFILRRLKRRNGLVIKPANSGGSRSKSCKG